MSMSQPGWRCTWHWSPPGVRPGPREPASQRFPTEAEARDKATALRALAAELGATVAVAVTREGAT